MTFTFPKSEKLCRKSDIETIFKHGKVIQEYPVKLLYHITNKDSIPLKAAFSVPKKKHRKAVDRNLLKRRMREAYRLNNQSLKEKLQNKKTAIHVFFIYLSNEKQQYRQIEDKIMLLLQRLENKYEENPK